MATRQAQAALELLQTLYETLDGRKPTLEDAPRGSANQLWRRAQTELLSLVQCGEHEAAREATSQAAEWLRALEKAQLPREAQSLVERADAVISFVDMWAVLVKEDEPLRYLTASPRARLVVTTIEASAPISQGHLAAELGMGKTNLCHYLNELRQRGLVSRTRDGKPVYYGVTSTATRVLSLLLPDRMDHRQDAAPHADEEQTAARPALQPANGRSPATGGTEESATPSNGTTRAGGGKKAPAQEPALVGGLR
jgi:hypothetical protein